MEIISILGTILVVVGLVLTTNMLSDKVSPNKSLGWAIAAVGMFLFFIHSVLLGKIISSILSLLFTLINTYFSVNYYKEETR